MLEVKRSSYFFRPNILGCLNYKIKQQLVTEFWQERLKQEFKYYVLNNDYCFQQ